MTRRVLRTASGSTEVTVGSGGEVAIGPETLAVSPAGPGAWRVVDAGGRARVVHAARAAEGWWVHADGAVFLVAIGGAAAGLPRRSDAGDGDLAAPMPATVLSIVAPEGASVRAGDVLLLLEAMKMELPIRAPRDGVVAAVRCREGELVQPGVPLVDLA